MPDNKPYRDVVIEVPYQIYSDVVSITEDYLSEKFDEYSEYYEEELSLVINDEIRDNPVFDASEQTSVSVRVGRSSVIISISNTRGVTKDDARDLISRSWADLREFYTRIYVEEFESVEKVMIGLSVDPNKITLRSTPSSRSYKFRTEGKLSLEETTQSSNIGQHKSGSVNLMVTSINDEDSYAIVDDTIDPNKITEATAIANRTTHEYQVMIDLVSKFIDLSNISTLDIDDFDYSDRDPAFNNKPSARVKLTTAELSKVDQLMKRHVLLKDKSKGVIRDNKGMVIIPAAPSKVSDQLLYNIYVQPKTKLLKVVCKVNPSSYRIDTETQVNSSDDYESFGE